jgi:hypothetical protein
MIADADIERARATNVMAILARRGVTLAGRQGWRCGPCPICGGTDRFAVHPQKRAFNCRGCGASGGSAIDLVAFLYGLDVRHDFFAIVERILSESANDEYNEPLDRTPDDDRQSRKALWLWRRRQPIQGTIAEKYLRGRGIVGPQPPTLAFLSPGKSDQHPALIAPFANDPTAPVDAVHLTLLAPDGNGKANVESAKIVVGRPLGRPIILAPGNDTLALAVTEGIEDGLSVHAATGLEVWAAGSASFLPALADSVPDYIEAVTIFAHADKAGQVGAIDLAEKLSARRIEVFIEGLA